MERIQSAIEKARANRQKLDSPAPRQAPREPLRKDQSDVVAVWEELTGYSPKNGVLQRNHILVNERSQMSMAVDKLRTKVLQIMASNGWTRVAITSASIGTGKTTTSVSLAYSIARQVEQRVCLIEMDIRRPNVLNVLGAKSSNCQFSNVLEGNADAKEHALRIGSNLFVGANQKSAANTSELLQSQTAMNALEEIEQRYQPTITILDMPPMLLTDDMMAFAPNCDCAIILAAAEETSLSEVDTCERELSEVTNVLGVVLNKCRYLEKEQTYEYY